MIDVSPTVVIFVVMANGFGHVAQVLDLFQPGGALQGMHFYLFEFILAQSPRLEEDIKWNGRPTQVVQKGGVPEPVDLVEGKAQMAGNPGGGIRHPYSGAVPGR